MTQTQTKLTSLLQNQHPDLVEIVGENWDDRLIKLGTQIDNLSLRSDAQDRAYALDTTLTQLSDSPYASDVAQLQYRLRQTMASLPDQPSPSRLRRLPVARLSTAAAIALLGITATYSLSCSEDAQSEPVTQSAPAEPSQPNVTVDTSTQPTQDTIDTTVTQPTPGLTPAQVTTLGDDLTRRVSSYLANNYQAIGPIQTWQLTPNVESQIHGAQQRTGSLREGYTEVNTQTIITTTTYDPSIQIEIFASHNGSGADYAKAWLNFESIADEQLALLDNAVGDEVITLDPAILRYNTQRGTPDWDNFVQATFSANNIDYTGEAFTQVADYVSNQLNVSRADLLSIMDTAQDFSTIPHRTTPNLQTQTVRPYEQN